MKFTELTKLPKAEADKKMHELQSELMKLNAQVAIGTTPKKTKQIREIKKTIARIETLRQQALEKKLNNLHVKKYINH